MRVTIASKGRLVVPAAIRRVDDIRAGQVFAIERLGRGEYRIDRVARARNEGVVDWLLACPEKGFFAPLVSESTPVRRVGLGGSQIRHRRRPVRD